jgi:hypothetical protein
MENSGTQVWLDLSLSCCYINDDVHKELVAESEKIGKLIYHMIEHPEKYIKFIK